MAWQGMPPRESARSSVPRPWIASREVRVDDRRTLRVAVLGSDATGPESLILAMGTGEGRAWREDVSEGLTLPFAACGPLLLALLDLGDVESGSPIPRDVLRRVREALERS